MLALIFEEVHKPVKRNATLCKYDEPVEGLDLLRLLLDRRVFARMLNWLNEFWEADCYVDPRVTLSFSAYQSG